MLQQYTEQIETLGLYGFYLFLFILMGMSVQDVLKRSNVPKFGRNIVWAVLFFGCVGFVFKAVVEILWTTSNS
jgi:hypothetical protein